MSLYQRNSKKQGDVGLGAAIAHFTRLGYTVSLPLTDSQDYDLIIDDDIGISRVQIKTTRYLKSSGTYSLSLDIKGGNQSFNTRKDFDPTKVDLIYILTGDGDEFLIPTKELTTKNCITLCSKMKQYRVYISPNSQLDLKENQKIQKEQEKILKAEPGTRVVVNGKPIYIPKPRPNKIEWPTDQELEKLVWKKPSSILAKELGISDRAIGKRCEAQGISKPPRGYWQKLK